MRIKRSLVLAVAVCVVVLGCAACQTVRPTGTPTGKTPVIFVHGWNEDETIWKTAVTTFEAAGYSSGDITQVYYDSTQAASVASATLATEVDYLRSYTGASKVDIVSHSYGAMVTKYCIESGGCANKVAHWMSLAGADNGTSIAGLCVATLNEPACLDMNGNTSTIADLQAAWPQMVSQGVKVEVQWSPSDGVIIPATNSQEPAPAVNVQLTGGQTHNQLMADPNVLAETLRFLAS